MGSDSEKTERGSSDRVSGNELQIGSNCMIGRVTPSEISRIMQSCDLCPRNCHIDRYVNIGACGAGADVYVARAALHFWEEPVISGSRGSGAVFFSGCNLCCIFCQNSAISHPQMGTGNLKGNTGAGEKDALYRGSGTTGNNNCYQLNSGSQRGTGTTKGSIGAAESGTLYRGSGTTVDNFCESHENWAEVGTGTLHVNNSAAERNCQTEFLTPGLPPGKKVSVEKLAEIFLRLQDEQGANNINLVTAAHFVPQVALALEMAKNRGLTIPVVYNTSSYEKVSALKMLDGLVDVYLPDFKYISPELAAKFSHAKDYPEAAIAAIDEMVRQVGEAEFVPEEEFVRKKDAGEVSENPISAEKIETLLTEQGQIDDKKGVYPPGGQLIKKGVIVRQLLLPGHVKESEKCLQFLHERYGNRIYISIMNQYTPMPTLQEWLKADKNGRLANDYDLAPLARKVTKREYSRIVDFAINNGIENGFTQTGDTAESSFIPDWNGEGVD